MTQAIRETGWRANKGPVDSNKSGFRACGHRLLLLGAQKEEVSSGGILLVKSHQDKEQQHQVWAEVVEIGHDAWSDKSTDFCDVGDKVLVGQYTGKFHDSPVDGKTYRFVQDLDVITPLVKVD
jgi:co-chaperonin GroES (HSP10)